MLNKTHQNTIDSGYGLLVADALLIGSVEDANEICSRGSKQSFNCSLITKNASPEIKDQVRKLNAQMIDVKLNLTRLLNEVCENHSTQRSPELHEIVAQRMINTARNKGLINE